MNSSGKRNGGQLFPDKARPSILYIPASSLQLTESFSVGWAWTVEIPRSGGENSYNMCSTYAEVKLWEHAHNYTSICWGADAIFLPLLSTTTADRVVWPIEAPFTRKTAVSLSVASGNGLQKNKRHLGFDMKPRKFLYSQAFNLL